MSRQPTLAPLPKENKYRLVRDFAIEVEGVLVVVPKYFRFDGASIPPAAWQLTYSPFHPDVMLPALIHDWMFYNHQENREVTDDIFYRLLKDNGVSDLKASAIWAAVRTAGELFWKNDEEDKKLLLWLCKKVKGRPNFDHYQFPPSIIQRCNGDSD